MTNQAKELYALFRSDFSYFWMKVFKTLNPGTTYLSNWHIKAMIHVLMQCYTGDIKRLIITIPPRYGKSQLATVAFPSWLLGQDPSKRVIGVSYSQSLSAEHANMTRKVIMEPWYNKTFSATDISLMKNTETFFQTTKGGSRFATSIGGTLTGKGGDLIIIDDPIKAGEEPSPNALQEVIDFYRGTLVTRLDDKINGCMIVIMQRVHENDLVGYLLENEPGWHHLNLPAIADRDFHIPIGPNDTYHRHEGELLHPEREPIEVLNQLRESLGPYSFAAQYLQNPVPIGGGIVKWDWFNQFDKVPERAHDSWIVQSWDTAATIKEHSCYSVCTTWLVQNNRYYLINVLRRRMEYPELLSSVITNATAYNARLIIIENNHGSLPLINTIRNHTTLCTATVTPRGDKETRMKAESVAIEAGKVILPTEASWLAEFKREIVRFPKSKHNDQVDSLSQFLYWARKRNPNHPTGGGIPGFGTSDDIHQPGVLCRVTLCGDSMPELSTADLFNMRFG